VSLPRSSMCAALMRLRYSIGRRQPGTHEAEL
jgi:hypothetical protein